MVIITEITDCDDSFEVLGRAWGEVEEAELDATCQLALDAVITGWHWTICEDGDCECNLHRIEG